jgi:cellobiose-specific phosphotransferase system component IIB
MDHQQNSALWNRLQPFLTEDFDANQVDGEVFVRCPFNSECNDEGSKPPVTVYFKKRNPDFECRGGCREHGLVEKLLERFEAGAVGSLPSDPIDVDYVVANDVGSALARTGKLKQKGKPELVGRPVTPNVPRPHRNLGERIIITLLALVFLGAGLSAAALSGFANYQAFSSSVADPLQAGIWGWTGVIAAVISFGGFTFFYWHTANKRMKEGVRALLFALAGAGTSILGTQMYIAANNQASAAEITTAGSNRALLEQQISDWRVQLMGIPPETRSVEGLQAYISEVERVGRTEQKPYRDAQNELGLARRRDDLQAKIEAANAELLGAGQGDILIKAQTRAAIPSWFFAGMLELFSSQGTSIGLVALLILYTRRRDPAAADA